MVPSKYSPLGTIHLSHLCFHCWKHPWNSSSLKPFSSNVISLLIIITFPKCRPHSTNLHLGNKKKLQGVNPASKGRCSSTVMELHAKNSRMINAECAGALSWWKIHRFPSHNSGRTRRTRSHRRFKTTT